MSDYPLKDYAVPVPSGLTLAEDQTIGELCRERREEIDRRCRELERARARAWAGAQTYVVSGA
jgi:hypothetical protein